MYTDYLDRLIQCLQATQIYGRDGTAFPNYEQAMEKLTGLFLEVRKAQRKVFFIGNGGSAAIASHMTADFMKNGGMRTCSLYDSAVLSCMGNDYGYEAVFAWPLEQLAEEGDLLVAVSSSGNSQNIVSAIETAKHRGLKVVTFSGFEKENRIRSLGMFNVYVPVSHYGIVESIHNLILQQIVDTILECEGPLYI